MILLEERPPCVFVPRFAGQRVVDWHGAEVVTVPIVEEAFGPIAHIVLQTYRACQQQPDGLDFAGTPAWQGRTRVRFQQTLWPLLCKDRSPRSLLNTIEFRTDGSADAPCAPAPPVLGARTA